jgi:hypothetical protein
MCKDINICESFDDNDLFKTYFGDKKKIFGFGYKENTIMKVLNDYPEHDIFENVLIKILLINSFYNAGLNTTVSTSTISLVDMANHIVHLERAEEESLTNLINDGNYRAVNLIGGLQKYNNAYCFASKYCSFHNMEKYPIMDSNARGFVYYFLKELNGRDLFNQYTQKDLYEYEKYADVVTFIKEDVLRDKVSYKQLDVFMWAFGKANKLAV